MACGWLPLSLKLHGSGDGAHIQVAVWHHSARCILPPMPTQLTKSRILSARQCRKRLWLESYAPELANTSDSSRGIISAGESIGRLARRVLAADGELITGPVADAANTTAKRLNAQHTATLHEASFGAASVFVRADLLWQANGQIKVAEVKSSSKVKAYHIEDCAVQYWVMREAGYKPDDFYLAHINKEFVLGNNSGAADATAYAGLFNLAPLNTEIANTLPQVTEWIRAADEVLASDKPNISTGPHCKKPHVCPFLSHCQASEPQVQYPIAQFPGLKANTKQQLLAEGAKDIRDVHTQSVAFAAELKEPEALARWQAAQRDEAWRSDRLVEQLTNLAYPRYYLDFESIAFSVPIWAGSKPFEQFPFQYSVHIETQAAGSGGREAQLHHREFLDLSGQPPMRALSEALIQALGDNGPIVVYTSFERTCINGLARRYPDLAPALQAINARLFDLHALVKKHYYHPAQNGSYSIKRLLPVVLQAGDADYTSLNGVSDGLAAQRAYVEAIAMDDNSQQKQRLERELLDYCGLDTLAMVKVVQRLLNPVVGNR